MASILKNQILKHLSKFTKNLSPDKINLSTLRGEGELTNLELDEAILMDLMDLPTWMRLKKAVCNRMSIKIVWTKLKSQPICIYLDEVILEVETCDDPRPPNNPAHLASYRSGGKYGFSDRVIDGIYVHINAVSVKFMSKKFHASLQLSRVVVQSKTPNWQKTDDLRSTKIRETSRGEILLFKEVEWQTTRIEATAVEGETNDFLLTPLRLIANQSKIRITIKKNLSDCSIISTRVMLYLDDILWVLTDTQLKAAILYGNSLRVMIDKSRQQSKKLAAETLQRQGQYRPTFPQQQTAPRARSMSNATPAQYFTRYDVQTTSYHLISSRIDLHLCDDSSPDKNVEKNPKHNHQIEGGAMQITFYKLALDIYPFNPAGGERKHWYRYMDNQGSRNFWVQQLFAAFKQEVTRARETCRVSSPSQSPAHEPANQRPPEKPHPANQNASRSPPPPPHQQVPPIKVSHQNARPRTTKLMESCTVLKVEEFTIYQVSTADNKRNSPRKFLSSDKKQLHLPSDMSVLHMEYTDYFFPEGIDYPGQMQRSRSNFYGAVPHANIYMLVNPIRLNLDYLTVLWINFFMLNLSQSVTPEMLDDTPKQHVDIKVEALMPRVILSADSRVESQPDRPNGVQLQVSKLCVTNTHVEERTGPADLGHVLDQYHDKNLFTSTQYPNNNNKLVSIPPHFYTFANGQDNSYMNRYAKDLVSGRLPEGVESQVGTDAIAKLLRTNTLKRNASFDMWCVCADQAWLEFVGVPSYKSRPLPFVETVPVMLWFCMPYAMEEATKKQCNSNLLDIVGVNGSRRSSNVGSHPASPDRELRPARQLLKEYYSTDSESYDTSPEDSPSLYDKSSSHKDQTAQLATYNVVAQIGGTVKAQMNHFQYLFIMRVLESFSNFQIQLTADVEHFLGVSSVPTSFSVPIVVPDLEFVMVCPYVAELLPFSNPMATSPSGASLHDGDLMDDEKEEEECPDLDSIIDDDHGEVISDIPDSESQSSSHTAISKSLSDSKIQCHSSGMLPGEETVGDPVMLVSSRISHSSQGLSEVHQDSSSGYDSSFGSRGSGSHQMKKSANKAADHVKKSFSSALSGISGLTDKIKAKIDHGEDVDDIDSMSIKTDTSEDDLDFEMLNLEEGELPAFYHPNIGGLSETASSTDTDVLDDMSSLYAESSAAAKGRELVSVIVFRVRGAEVLLQSDDDDMAVRIQAWQLSTKQPGNMYYEDFYDMFTSTPGICGPVEGPCEHNYTVKLKIVTGPGADKELPDATVTDSPGYLSVMAENCGLTFKTSSLANMAKFLEDELTGTTMPMHITVGDFLLSLKDDTPNPKGQPAPPVECNIHKLAISRGYDGIFHLTAEPVLGSHSLAKVSSVERQESEPESQSVLSQQALLAENRQLRKSLEEMSNLLHNQKELSQKVQYEADCIQRENDDLQSKLNGISLPSNGTNENDITANAVIAENLKLQHQLVCMEDEVHILTKEKNSLLDTLKLLQDELFESEARRRRIDSHS